MLAEDLSDKSLSCRSKKRAADQKNFDILYCVMFYSGRYISPLFGIQKRQKDENGTRLVNTGMLLLQVSVQTGLGSRHQGA